MRLSWNQLVTVQWVKFGSQMILLPLSVETICPRTIPEGAARGEVKHGSAGSKCCFSNSSIPYIHLLLPKLGPGWSTFALDRFIDELPTTCPTSLVHHIASSNGLQPSSVLAPSSDALCY